MLERGVGVSSEIKYERARENKKTLHLTIFPVHLLFCFLFLNSFSLCISLTRPYTYLYFSLQVCLFGEEEISLRDQIRNGSSNEDIEHSIENALSKKNAALGGHADMHKLAKGNNRPMILIGG